MKLFPILLIVLTITGSLIAYDLPPIKELPFEALPTKPLSPKDNPTTKVKIELGKQLYFDPRLSIDGTVSCNSCHHVFGSGTDNRALSIGVRAQKGGRSSPTVFNAAFYSVQFWDGRANTLEDQAKGPLTNPIEMGMPDHASVVNRLMTIPGYVESFDQVFGKAQLNIDNVAKAIAAFERTLITPSPFDQFLQGNRNALNDSQKKGLATILEVGCTSCHNGLLMNGPEMPIGEAAWQKFPTFTDSEYVQKYDLLKDKGRADATKNEEDAHFYRVPTWRNISLTAPYFHNGSVKSLEEAVRVMAKVQLNKTITDEQVQSIVAFLGSLTGELPKMTLPKLPPTSGTSLVGND